MTTFYLIRHGLTDAVGKILSGWTPGIHLNQTGQAQAEQLVERFQSIRIDAVFSSPLERCVETAMPLAGAKGLTLQTAPELGEVQYGSWTGRAFSEIETDPLWK